MLRKKAAEELKKEQERKAAERRRIIEERCGKPKNIEDANEGIVDHVAHSKEKTRSHIFSHYSKNSHPQKIVVQFTELLIEFSG